jgi:hypothetical protein
MVFVVCFLVHFQPFYVYFHKCPPANGKSPKLRIH